MNDKLQNYGRVNRFDKDRKLVVLNSDLDMAKISKANNILRPLSVSTKDNLGIQNLSEHRAEILAALTPEVREKFGIKQDFNCNDDYPIEDLVTSRIVLLSVAEQKGFLKSLESAIEAKKSENSSELKL